MSPAQLATRAMAAPQWLHGALIRYRREIRTRRILRLFPAMDDALETGDRAEAERLFRHASAAVSRTL